MCFEVMRENKRLKADLSALGDEGFWQAIEVLQIKCDEGAGLAQESLSALSQFVSAFPSIEPPADLLGRLERFAVASVASAAA